MYGVSRFVSLGLDGVPSTVLLGVMMFALIMASLAAILVAQPGASRSNA
tara:strand:+ start:11891 stop:12037 length:147 start_codon:yes stop_codon:yes gene_type:complete